MPTKHPMPPERERELFRRGVELFNAGEYFEAHEVWEEIWHAVTSDAKRSFYQGMIQCAVALEHYRRGNLRGVRSLAGRYPAKFRKLPPLFMGLNVPQFLAEMHESLRPALDASPPPAPAIPEPHPLDPSRAPRITLPPDAAEPDQP